MREDYPASNGFQDPAVGQPLAACPNTFRPDPQGAHRLTIGIDIAVWSSRDGGEQARQQNALRTVVETALPGALGCGRGVERQYYAGDAALVILPAAIDVATVSRRFLTELLIGLARANRPSAPANRVRLRIGLEIGPVIHGAGGPAGDGVIGACRLRDCQTAKDALDSADGDCIVVASDYVYHKVLQQAFADGPHWEFSRRLADVPGRYSAPCWVSLPAC